MMYLENVGVSTVELMDSVKLTAAGKFSFTKPRPAFPDFYRLRLNNQLINFSVDSTETISFVADAGTFATSYSVEGSENCKAIKNITLAQLDANQAIHRLRKESESGLLADSVYSRQVLEAAEAYKDVLVSIFIPPRCPLPLTLPCSSKLTACCSSICMTRTTRRLMAP